MARLRAWTSWSTGINRQILGNDTYKESRAIPGFEARRGSSKRLYHGPRQRESAHEDSMQIKVLT